MLDCLGGQSYLVHFRQSARQPPSCARHAVTWVVRGVHEEAVDCESGVIPVGVMEVISVARSVAEVIVTTYHCPYRVLQERARYIAEGCEIPETKLTVPAVAIG